MSSIPSAGHHRAAALRRTILLGALFALIGAGCTPDMKARVYAGDDRDEWQQKERVIAALALEPGQSVADLGAGGGYFTFDLADAVGPAGLVYAVDVDEEMNERLAGLADERGYAQVQVVLAGTDDPRIPGDGVDLIFTSNTYHHIDDRERYFRDTARYLRPGGRLAVLDYRDEGLIQTIVGHATDGEVIKEELGRAGYRLVAEHDFIEKQHFLVFASGHSPQ